MLDNENKEHNLFPIDVFPSFFRELTVELKKSLNYPVDYTGTALLVAVSTAIGTSVKIRVKSSWEEFASLYCCLIGNAGANKTHPINKVFEPLKNIDGINHEIYKVQYKEFVKYEKLSKTEKKNVPKVEEPIPKKHILTNFTPEALFRKLSENPRGCTVVSDEMFTFFENMSNYSKGNQIGNYLSLSNNQPVTIDRVGEPISLYINSPFLSIIGGLQPRMLGDAFSAQKLNNGFYQRFLFAYPDNAFKQPINDNEMDENLIKYYSQFITDYIKNNTVVENNGVLNSRILNWTDESKVFFYNWQRKNTERVIEYQDSIKGEILSKYDNHFIRLALILQIMETPKSCTIELKAVEGAEKLCNYYINCSFKILEILQSPETYLKSLPENKINFYNALPNEFATGKAIELGLVYELAERRTKDFLKDEILFINTKHGFYKKKIIQK